MGRSIGALSPPPRRFPSLQAMDNPALILAGLAGGFTVGLTGMGGGALMTPALVLLFKIEPKVAVASELVNSLVLKPIGGGVHMGRGTIHWSLLRALVLGARPS